MEDRHLNFNAFINERATEIMKFSQALELDTKKKGHQALPKSVRRRAMSHNKYRIPLKIRRPMQESLAKAQSMQKLPKCRKSIRKRHRLLLSYKLRNSKDKWLPTHLWCAKRMRMIKYFGYKIAYSPNDKCFRSAYRYFRHNACLVDLSFFQCLKVNLQTLQIPDVIHIKDKIGTKYIKTLQQISTSELYYGQLYDQLLVCPLLIMTYQNTLYCFFDPCSKQEVLQNQRLSCNLISHHQIISPPFQIYAIIGPQALERVQQVLKDQIIDQNRIQQIQTKLAHPLYARKNSMLFYDPNKVESQAKKSRPKISMPFQALIKTGYDSNFNVLNRKIIEQIIKNKKPQQQQVLNEESGPFWNFYNQQIIENINEQMPEEMFIKVSTRSKYTHKRTNKLTKEEKKKILLEDQQKRKLLAQQEVEQEKQQDRMAQEQVLKEQVQKMILKKSKYQNQRLDPLAIGMINNYDSSMLMGCYLFCNSSNNCKIWRNLTKMNLKVIGQRQFKHCLLEAGIRSFPQDYPGTKSYTNYCKEKSIKLINRQRRLPNQKRINYAKINSPSPFITNIQLEEVQQVRIEMVSRGRCFTGSYICKLNSQDFQIIEQYLEKGCIKHIVEEQKKCEKKNEIDYKMSYEQINKKLKEVSEVSVKRKTIGFVTTGGFLYSRCREGGLGFIFREPKKEMQNQSYEKYVLIRKPTSRYYYLGFLI